MSITDASRSQEPGVCNELRSRRSTYSMKGGYYYSIKKILKNLFLVSVLSIHQRHINLNPIAVFFFKAHFVGGFSPQKLIYLFVMATHNVRLKLTTPRQRVTCSSDWAGLVPLSSGILKGNETVLVTKRDVNIYLRKLWESPVFEFRFPILSHHITYQINNCLSTRGTMRELRP